VSHCGGQLQTILAIQQKEVECSPRIIRTTGKKIKGKTLGARSTGPDEAERKSCRGWNAESSCGIPIKPMIFRPSWTIAKLPYASI
jgi:hypothetical protein